MVDGNKEFFKNLRHIVGESNVLIDKEKTASYLKERRGRFFSDTCCVIEPESTEQVSAIVNLCRNAGIPIVPQGGNTGVCGGAVSDTDTVIVNLRRMNRIQNVDATGYTIEADSGCVLSDLQSAALEKGLYLPLSLGAEGTCQIGGNLSTNAGGVNVLRYGNVRDLTLGIEVVLPNGEVWNGMNALRKNNTGYDLKNAFIGAEGTLGIITAAVLKLFPRPTHRATMIAAVENTETAVDLFARTRRETSDFASSFELMSRQCIESAMYHIPECRDFFKQPYEWYVLIELGDSTSDGISKNLAESFLSSMFDNGIILDAVIATNEKQAQQMWRMREAIVEAQNYEGKSIKNDVSVPLVNIARFIQTTIQRLETMIPGSRCFVYGHIGDGNIHFNLSQPLEADGDKFFKRWFEVTDVVHEIANELGGSFSAEHGIGLLKTRDMTKYKSLVELDLMRTLKSAFDPHNIMNPGKVLPERNSLLRVVGA